jgi:hypothetical protein
LHCLGTQAKAIRKHARDTAASAVLSKTLTKAAIDPREDRGGEDRVGVDRANSLLAPVLLRAPPLPLLGVQNLGYDDAKPYGGVTRMKVRHAAVGMALALALATLIVAHDLGIF